MILANFKRVVVLVDVTIALLVLVLLAAPYFLQPLRATEYWPTLYVPTLALGTLIVIVIVGSVWTVYGYVWDRLLLIKQEGDGRDSDRVSA